ncbi:glycerol-3-phosphate dehydrogenase [Vibrio sp. SS-MA-C1-2]|uniref:glycerol-3-phosphate dehydrogenase n=1 Tax=Vibrio sp. SS-MA-C1-2 TaxID=2908646 RepID=UPI001F407877|nr:glycerol-3-phosphate dehydrogenase [Vibrio sp. SS-MA-C1-2]UJF19290.1 glycerol-3-phosphate dehydrogenase [Vibrio sp. SS-MA-C1-2]
MMEQNNILDLIIVGGGINGAGIAADAAGRGLSVGIYDANDFASATSSASSKLIHGGLRYLEHYEFRLVGEALAEREVLLKKAPHIAHPLRFRLPHQSHLRPAWMIRAGLFLYDNLAKRASLPSSKGLRFGAESVLKPEIVKGFEYSDCWVDDARLVILNLISCAEQGAEVRNYCKVEDAVQKEGIWHVTIKDQRTGKVFVRQSKALVNAAGPWVKEFFDSSLELESPRNIRLVKGSHIVVPKVHAEPQAYILQNADNRIVFVIPYMDKFSIIGTTDVEYKGDPREVTIDDQEQAYLLDIYNQYFKKQLQLSDIVWNYSGVRPLCDDESSSAQAVTRDYTLELDESGAPILSIFGGKLTTYRKLAESAMKKLAPHFPEMGQPWTAEKPLPGGDFTSSRGQLILDVVNKCSWISSSMATRLVTNYGSRVWDIVSEQVSEMGRPFSEHCFSREIDYLIDSEFVTCGDDLLWRRSKLGLYLTEQEIAEVNRYIDERVNALQLAS